MEIADDNGTVEKIKQCSQAAIFVKTSVNRKALSSYWFSPPVAHFHLSMLHFDL